jgi:hypothetical protein
VCRLKNATLAKAQLGGSNTSNSCPAGTASVWAVDNNQTFATTGMVTQDATAKDLASCQQSCVKVTVSCAVNNKSHLQNCAQTTQCNAIQFSSGTCTLIKDSATGGPGGSQPITKSNIVDVYNKFTNTTGSTYAELVSIYLAIKCIFSLDRRVQNTKCDRRPTGYIHVECDTIRRHDRAKRSTTGRGQSECHRS